MNNDVDERSDDRRLVMTMLVRNEEDIIAENIEFHRARGVDHFIITDNRSTDSTPDILANYADLGWVSVIRETDDDYNQSKWVTRMARMASGSKHGASWVINNDADEFWFAACGNLKECLVNQPNDINAVTAPRHDFAYCFDEGSDWHQKMIYRKLVSRNHLGLPLPDKMAHRAHPDIVVEQGNHMIKGLGPLMVAQGGIEILHFPVRSKKQFEQKILNGGAAYSRNVHLPKTIGRGWRKLYQTIQDEGSLSGYLDSYGVDENTIEAGLADGSLILDKRVAKFAKELQSNPRHFTK